MGSPSLAAGDTPASIHAAHPRPPQLAQGSRPCASAATPRQRRRSPHRLLPRSPRRAPRQRHTTSAKTEDLYRGDAASELRRACRWRRYWQVWGEALGSPPWLSLPPRRLAACQGAELASPRRDQSWTVFHPPTGVDGISFTVHPGWLEVVGLSTDGRD
jgi:hypothetical protein